MSSEPDPLLGGCISRYQIVETLGVGGMGTVYRVQHVDDGRILALKVVRMARETLLPRLRREIHALSRLRHPGIVRILDHGLFEGMPWYAMEMLDGRTLSHLRDDLFGVRVPVSSGDESSRAGSGGQGDSSSTRWWTRSLISVMEPVPALKPVSIASPHDMSGTTLGPGPLQKPEAAGGRLQEVLGLLRRLCSPLSHLHGEGIVHCDLKPDNVIVRPEGTPVIVDFGLAVRVGGALGREALELDSKVSGTIAYIAPEQLEGRLIDARADLYSLSCILYELLTGRPPFVGRPSEVLSAHLNQEPLAPSRLVDGVPHDLDELVLRLLVKEPRQRTGYATDVSLALGRLGAEDAQASHLPPPRVYLYRPRLAGREEELDNLKRELERLRGGSAGPMVLLGGQSGVGKTRLALELGRKAQEAGFNVLAGECAAVTVAERGPVGQTSALLAPLRPALLAVADRCRERGLEATERLLGRRGKVLSRYEPGLLGLPGQERHPEAAELPADAARMRLYSDLAETLAALAEEALLLLVLDDLQWADELTLGFLHHLVRTASFAGPNHRSRLLVLGTYRTEEIGETLRALFDLSGVRHLRLKSLGEGAVGQIVCDMLALLESPILFTRYLSRRSEGNPFFVAEYLRTAVLEALLWRDAAGSWQMAEEGEAKATEEAYERLPLPRSIRDLVARHLARLGATAQRLIEAAAVLGKEVDGSLLASVSAVGAVEVLEGTLELLDQQVMEESGRGKLRFVHDKLREVAYDQLTEPRRVELHRSAAEALEALGPERREENPASLGHHWEHAGVFAKAREFYLAAARKAKDGYVHAEAERLYRAYLRLMEAPTPESIAGRNELGAEVLRVQGRTEEALAEHREALQEARWIGHRWSETESLRLLGQLLRAQGRIEPARELYEEALGIAREIQDRRLEGRVLDDLGLCRSEQARFDEAHELFQQALAIQREVGDRWYEGLVLGDLAGMYRDQGRSEEALKLIQEAIVIHREVGNRAYEGRLLGVLAGTYHDQGWIEEARKLYQEALAIQREVGNRAHEGRLLCNLAGSYHDEGGVEEAQKLYRQALVLLRQAEYRRYEGLVLGNLGNLFFDQGGIEEAQELFEQALAIHREIGNRYYEGFVLGDLADSRRLAKNETGRAEQLARDAEALLTEVGDRLELGRLLCIRGHIELAGGRSAGELLDRAERLGTEMNVASDSQLAQKLARLRRAQEAFDAGQHERLFRGDLVEDLPEGLRRWLVETGQLPQDAPSRHTPHVNDS